jgi:SAM-dependent methyltransferase
VDRSRLEELVLARYSAPKEVRHYAERAGQGLRNWESHVVQMFMVPGRVLSLGCGGGRETFALERMGYVSYGVDISTQQIESAKRTRDRVGSTATFLVYDGSRLPFADEFFGSVTLWSQVLGNVPGTTERENLLEKCRGVLTRGGILSLSVHDREKTLVHLRDEGYRYSVPADGEAGDLLLDTEGGPCYWHYFTGCEIRRACLRAGFEVVLQSTSDRLGQDWDNLHIVVCRKPLDG